MATHAVDIIEEVEPEDVISIDKKSNISKRLSTIDEVQTCITQLGSYQNLKLVNFIRGKTCLFVEGKDFNFLKKVALRLGNDQFAQENGFSVIPLDGFSNWERLLHINWIFENAFGEKVKCYVMLDRDYYSDSYIDNVTNNLSGKGVKVHVWSKKELENYLINFNLLFRIFSNKYHDLYRGKEIPITFEDFESEMVMLFESFKKYVQGQIISKNIEYRLDRGEDPSVITTRTLEEFDDNWNDIEYRNAVSHDYYSIISLFKNS